MKKINSTFKTAFVSEPGTELVNNDYFAFIELDDYACYVLADGISDEIDSGAAKYAVEMILSRFQENPSLKPRRINKWLTDANDALTDAYQYNKLKASVMVVVTDYESLRYASAGNVRMRLYRSERAIVSSADMSLAQQLKEKQEIGANALDRHIQRNNLYCYLGQEQAFDPYISPLTKVADGDIVALYSRGIWENISEQEINEVFGEASDEPQKSVDMIEDMLLSSQPEELVSYTVAAVFMDQVFRDPLRDIRRQRRIKIAIIICIILLIIGVIGFVWNHHRNNQQQDMEHYIKQTEMLIRENNFPRAQKDCQKARELADTLKDESKAAQLDTYESLIDAIMKADDAYKGKNYADAYSLYQEALEIANYADGLGKKYIARRMAAAEKHLTVGELIAMADKLVQSGELDGAEAKYLEAQAKAWETHSPEDKQLADNALMKFYDVRTKAKKAADDKTKKAIAETVSDYIAMAEALAKSGDTAGAERKLMEARNIAAANYDDAGKKNAMAALDKLSEAKGKKTDESVAAARLTADGDKALASGDIHTATALYLAAFNKYNEIGDKTGAASVNGKLEALGAKQKESAQTQSEAEGFVKEAERLLYDEHDAYGAKNSYMKALSIYQSSGNKAKADNIKNILEQLDTDIAITQSNRNSGSRS